MTNEQIAKEYIEAKLIWDQITSDDYMNNVTDWDAYDTKMDKAYSAYHLAELALLKIGEKYLRVAGITEELFKKADPSIKEKIYNLLLSSVIISE